MLTREDFERYEKVLHKEIATRQALGGYSPEADTIRFLCQMVFELMRHIRETSPPPTPPSTKRKTK